MRKLGILKAVNRLLNEFADLTLNDQRFLARILANVSANALDEELVDEVARSTILKHLVEWMNSPDLDLSLRGKTTNRREIILWVSENL